MNTTIRQEVPIQRYPEYAAPAQEIEVFRKTWKTPEQTAFYASLKIAETRALMGVRTELAQLMQVEKPLVKQPELSRDAQVKLYESLPKLETVLDRLQVL